MASSAATVSSRALASSVAESKRPVGSTATAFCSMTSISAGMPSWNSEGSGAGSVLRAASTSAAVSPSQGPRPVSSSNRSTPTAYMSDASVARRPRTCSGLRYQASSTDLSATGAGESAMTRPTPKSATLMRPSRETMMLLDRRAPCTTPRSCAAAMAVATTPATFAARRGGTAPFWRSSVPRSWPSMNSVTMYGPPGSVPKSEMARMLGWLTAEAARSWSRKSATKSGSAPSSGFRTFTATVPFERTSVARKRVEMASSPRSSMSR